MKTLKEKFMDIGYPEEVAEKLAAARESKEVPETPKEKSKPVAAVKKPAAKSKTPAKPKKK